jgi:hypothetical protein
MHGVTGIILKIHFINKKIHKLLCIVWGGEKLLPQPPKVYMRWWPQVRSMIDDATAI